MNPYENAFDFGDVSFAGDPTPCKRKLSELPQPPFNYCTSEAEGNTSVINEPRPGPSQSQLPPPRSMNELYKRRFRRPYITEEGYNLDDYRDEKAPMPTDPGYLASKKDILKHRDMIRNKFSTMQSANNITHMLYFEQPLDPKRAISGTYPYESKKKIEPKKKKEDNMFMPTKTFKEIWQAKQQVETLKVSNIGKKPRNASILENSIFASIFEKYSKENIPNYKKSHKIEFSKENFDLHNNSSKDISKYSAIFEQYENNIGDTSFERESALETSFSMDMSRYPFYKM